MADRNNTTGFDPGKLRNLPDRNVADIGRSVESRVDEAVRGDVRGMRRDAADNRSWNERVTPLRSKGRKNYRGGGR